MQMATHHYNLLDRRFRYHTVNISSPRQSQSLINPPRIHIHFQGLEMSSTRGEFDLICAAIISFSKNAHVRSTYQHRWVLDSVLSHLINELIDSFDITTPKMNKALCGTNFKVISDDF